MLIPCVNVSHNWNVANEYRFTVSHAVGYQKYFHPKTRVALSPSHE